MFGRQEIQNRINSEGSFFNVGATSESRSIESINSNGNNNPGTISATSTYLSCSDYFMNLCFLTAAQSKDPHTKVGACIVDGNNQVISVGYNGMPRGIPDEELTWEKTSPNYSETKYAYVCHAEMNAILNHKFGLEQCILYVTLYPCNECAKMIIQSGIKEVIYGANTEPNSQQSLAAEKMFRLANVKCREYQPQKRKVLLCASQGNIFFI